MTARRTVALLGAVLAVAVAAMAVRARNPGGKASPITVPFELRGDLALVHADMNGVAGVFILDSGSGVNVVDRAFASQAKLEMDGPRARVSGAADESVQLATARTMHIADAVVERSLVAPIDLTPVQARTGRDIRGTIGYDLFARYVVAVDYAARMVTLHDPATFSYAGGGVIVPVTTASRVPIAEATLTTVRHGEIPLRLTLDLGSTSWALRLGARVVQQRGLADDASTITGPFGAGIGGVSEGLLLRFPRLRLGALVIERPSAALSSDPSGAFGPSAKQDGTIGVPVFRRALTIFDYARSRVIIEARAPLDVPDQVDASGLTLVVGADADAPLRVQYVMERSAGAEAGVCVDDELLRVDDEAASERTLDAIRQILRRDGTSHRLVIRRAGRTLDLSIALRSIL